MDKTDLKLKALARMVHEANKAYCESLGDYSQKPWTTAPKYNHNSATIGVRAVYENPNISPEEIHGIWMGQKLQDGWVYGETKCYDKKTHPCLIPYDQLNAVEKYKDYLVIYITKSYTDFLNNK